VNRKIVGDATPQEAMDTANANIATMPPCAGCPDRSETGATR